MRLDAMFMEDIPFSHPHHGGDILCSSHEHSLVETDMTDHFLSYTTVNFVIKIKTGVAPIFILIILFSWSCEIFTGEGCGDGTSPLHIYFLMTVN